MTRRPWRRATVQGLVMTVLLAGCGLIDVPPRPDTAGLTPPTTAAPPGPLVLMVGDSITQFAREQVAATFTSRGWNNAVVGRAGTTLDENRAKLLGARQLQPQALVVELGTNDLGRASQQYRDPEDQRSAVDDTLDVLDRTLDELSDLPCVVWVNVSDWTNFLGYDTTAGGPRFNQALADAAASRPWLHVVDYAGLFRPDTPDRTAWLAANFDQQRLHPASAEANRRWITATADTVATACNLGG